MPAPTPSPRMADNTPMAPATRSAGNSSRMMPKASGNTAPAAPWTTRPTIMTVSEVASALTRVPTLSATNTTTSIFSLPTWSPMRPRMGVAMAALRRYAVSSQLAPFSDVCKVCSSWGIAGMIKDCSKLNASAAVARTTKVTPMWVRVLAMSVGPPEPEPRVPVRLAKAEPSVPDHRPEAARHVRQEGASGHDPRGGRACRC